MAALAAQGTTWKRTLLLLVLATALTLAIIGARGAAPAEAWYCSPSGSPPFQHYSHNHSPYIHQYISGHDHSNGAHHHIWDVWNGSTYQGRVHVECSGPT